MPLGKFNERVPDKFAAAFVAGNTTAAVNMISGGAAGTFHIDHVYGFNTDTIDHAVDLFYVKGGTSYALGRPNVPAASGTAGANAVDILAACLTNSDGLDLLSGEGFQAAMAVTILSTNVVTIVITGGYY